MKTVYSTSSKTYSQGTTLNRDYSSLEEKTNLNALANSVELRIISQLEHLRPGKNNKISHYAEKLVKLSSLICNVLTLNTLYTTKNTFTHTNYA